MDSFDAVWGRVTGSVTVTEREYDDRAVLRGFMDDEAVACRLYSALSVKCPAFSRALSRMALDERCHLRRHQLEYFLLYGDSYAPSPACPAVCGIAAALRAAYIDEKAAHEAYLRAAGETRNHTLSECYREIALDEAGHAAELRMILAKTI